MSKDRPPMKRPQRAANLIQELLQNRGMDKKLHEYRAWLVWDQVVGRQIAARARPIRIRDGVLEVRVDHPVWMQQLQMLKPRILSRLAEELGPDVIRDIFWRRGSIAAAAPSPSVEPPPQLPPLDPSEETRIESAVSTIEDPEIRASLQAVLRRQRQIDKGRIQG